MLDAARFEGKTGFQYLDPARPAQGQEWDVVSTVANAAELSPWCLARLAEALPEGSYRLAEGDPGPAMLGWLLGQHRLNDYKSKDDDQRGPRVLLTKEAAEIERTVRLAEATALVRDLVDTPAADMGPAELEAAARDLAKAIRRQGRGDRRRRAGPGLSDDRRGRPGRDAGPGAAADRAPLGQGRRAAESRSSARASASTAAGSTSSRPPACG